MYVIRDIMSKVVISVRPEATMMDAVKTLTKHHISGVPVVTAQGEVIGFISEQNLMDVLFDADVRKAPVTEFMSRDIHVIDSHEPLSVAAKILATYNVRRLPVVESGRFIGVMTRRDLLAHALHNPELLGDSLPELIPSSRAYS